MKQMDRQALAALLESQDISALSLLELQELLHNEAGLSPTRPDGLCRMDPRSGDFILYASRRSGRPQDNLPAEAHRPFVEKECPICQGQTTGIVDVAELSAGFTFINANLFPISYPFGSERGPGTDCEPRGMHFLQWTSSLHDQDWHNMSLADLAVVMDRLAELEKKLLEAGEQVLILKNYGRLVGGSLIHGHQQIILTSLLPNRFRDNRHFLSEKGELFSAFLQRENPTRLRLRDYGPAVLLVPYFMRRPLEMMLLLKDANRQYLHELSIEERLAVVRGWQEAIRVMRLLMPQMGRETAYNITCHNGSGAGLYFEFLPYTQEIGGLEHLGIYACQETPQRSAERILAALPGLSG